MIKRGGRMLPSTQRALIVLPIWCASLIWMWLWWLSDERVGYALLYVPLTLALIYEFALLPSIFLYFLLRAKYPPKRKAEKYKRVAVISLCVPAKESMDIVEQQLKAMSNISYPHDSWILDEGNSKEIKKLAKKYGVKHYSRKGIKKYNKPFAPFAEKTKAGNVNAWLDHVKNDDYDFFVQFDIDHIAKPYYLDKTLGYFRDANVAWVQAPSVYKNHQHWTARGSSEQELVLQGPLQMGFYGHSKTPFIIGSHCTYRTSAIREIGGFQPTRAEDHLDTVMLANKGYSGVFVPEVIAEGDGPETLETYLGQQFAWAFSMFQVLMSHSPRLLRGMPWSKKLQFLFSQTWYPLWSTSYFITFLIPVVSLTLNREVANMQANEFITHFVPMFICSFLVWWCAKPLMQPKNISLTWRGMLLHVVRWPIVLYAVVSAALRIKKSYMITPKGNITNTAPRINVYLPFLALALISTTAVIYANEVHDTTSLISQTIFAVTNATFMLSICLTDLDIRMRKALIKVNNVDLSWIKPTSSIILLTIVLGYSLVSSPAITYQNVEAFSEPSKVESIKQINPSNDISGLLSAISNVDKAPIQEPTVGIYDPAKVHKSTQPYIRHSFVDWRNKKQFAHEVLISNRAQNVPLITIEPRGTRDGEILLNGIASGKYDSYLKDLSSVVSASNGPVYIRFAHEMELLDLYPWGGQSPESYIEAYRYVVAYMRAAGADNAKWVWSPAGNVGSHDYYPGDDVVDVVGTTMLYDQYFYGEFLPTFYDLAQSRSLLQSLNKPVWIVEFGAGKVNKDYQKRLLAEALNEYKLEGYSAIVYLNAADSNISGPDYRLNRLDVFGELFAYKPPVTVPARTEVKSSTKPETRPVLELPEFLQFKELQR